MSIVTHELCDPLRPLLAVHLSSTAKGLWMPMQEQLAELRQRHAEAAAVASLTHLNPTVPARSYDGLMSSMVLWSERLRACRKYQSVPPTVGG